jgi:transposase
LAESIGTAAACPRCQIASSARHSSYQRRFWDLPIQGRPVRITCTVGRWQCRNADCGQSIFTERLPGMAAPRARQTRRAAGILRLLGHGVGGRPGERLAARLGFVGSRTTILRHLMQHQLLPNHSAPRVVGLDEWASRKGLRFGTIAVDLERRTVIDVLPDRSAVSTAAWLAERPSIELIARDRDGLYADASRQGAPQARQIADRFHLVQNLRDRIEQHLSGQRQRPVGPTEERQDGADRANLNRADRLEGLQRLFARVHELFRQGWTVADIARHLDINRRRVDKWVRLEALPERFQCDPKPTSPMRFHAPLQELMRKGVTKIRWLFDEAKKLGYKGSFGHMARYVAHVRSLARADGSPAPAERIIRSLPLDPASGSRISPVVAAAICMKPRPLLTERQVGMLAVLKNEVAGFAVIRRLAIRFQSLLRHRDEKKLEPWLTDAKGCGIPVVVNFARKLMVDIQAVRNAVIEPWSNGQTEGQINRLKALKRAMYGRASVALLCARMRPLREVEYHQM